MTCGLCHDGGWVLDCRLDKRPLMLELIECPIPDCEASARPVQGLQIKGPEFTEVARHPVSGIVMSLSAARLVEAA